jgi:hypothetical protein
MAGARGRVEVRAVAGRGELKRFLRFPWRIYAGDPAWVPPLLMDVKGVLDRKKHPFHQHGEAEYFLAWRGDEVVGRIAAAVNHLHNEFHQERTGFFGFFECLDDAEAARALFAAAEAWLRERGMERVRGPMSFSTNEEAPLALLVEGFEEPPRVMMAHNPPYYEALIEGGGFEKAKDLLAYTILRGDSPPERLVRGVERIVKAKGIRVRMIDVSRFHEDVDVIKEIYNSAWKENWGFVPMTDAEFAHLAKQFKPVMDPHLCLIAETAAGEPAGFALALPDFNQALKHIDGRLFPLGLFKLLWHRRKIDQMRILTLGVKSGFRRSGLDAVLYLRLFREAHQRNYQQAECSWILEDNWDMRRALEGIGARVYKTYRLYDKML